MKHVTRPHPTPPDDAPRIIDSIPTKEIEIQPYPNPVPENEIEHIHELHLGITRQIRKVFKDMCEIGDWFNHTREKSVTQRGCHGGWQDWIKDHFPNIPRTVVYQYRQIAENREFLKSVSSENILSQNEALRLIRAKNKMHKPRVRSIVVAKDADPMVVLEAKLKNYVINLWMQRYLQAEIEQLIEAMELKPDQVLRVLHYVCKEHHEVQDEVLRTFKPSLKVVSKGA